LLSSSSSSSSAESDSCVENSVGMRWLYTRSGAPVVRHGASIHTTQPNSCGQTSAPLVCLQFCSAVTRFHASLGRTSLRWRSKEPNLPGPWVITQFSGRSRSVRFVEFEVPSRRARLDSFHRLPHLSTKRAGERASRGE
jgi:hypothetical protein